MGPGITGSTNTPDYEGFRAKIVIFPSSSASRVPSSQIPDNMFLINQLMNEWRPRLTLSFVVLKTLFWSFPKGERVLWQWILSVRLMRDPCLHVYKWLLAGFSPGERDNSEKIHQRWRWLACLPIWMTGPDLCMHLEILRLTFYSFSFLLLWIMMTIIITGNVCGKLRKCIILRVLCVCSLIQLP